MDLTEDDVKQMKRQGDLGEFLRSRRFAAHATAASRRALVLRYPDLAAVLTRTPLDYDQPEQWTGYVPPATLPDGQPNRTPIRTALLELLARAEHRTQGAAA